MLNFVEITIGDKELFEKYTASDKPQASDVCFTNLFMWRGMYKFRYAEVAGLMCVIAVPDNKKPYAMAPLGDLNRESFDQAMEELKKYFSNNDWPLVFKRVEERKLEFFRKHAREENIIFDRDNSDYVYSRQDLTELKGKKFDGKRNHINKFKKLYEYEYVPISEENINDCYEIMEKWCNERGCDDHKEFYCEKLANTQLMENYSLMGCKGALVKVNGKMEGFTVGEMLNDNTAVIHIEKANSSVNGLYTYINQQFCVHEWQGAEFINREQDLGIEGLRKAKLSYNPVGFVNKYTVVCS